MADSLFTAQELATAVQFRIPVVIVLVNDGAYGNVRRIQADQFGNRLIACDLRNPDFQKYVGKLRRDGAAGDIAGDAAGGVADGVQGRACRR